MSHKIETEHLLVLDEWHKAILDSDQKESVLNADFWQHIEYNFMKDFDRLIELRASQAVKPPEKDLLDMGQQAAIKHLRGYRTKVRRLNLLYGVKILFKNLRLSYLHTSVQLREEIQQLKRDIKQREWAIWMYKRDCNRLYKNLVFLWQCDHSWQKMSDNWQNMWIEAIEENRRLKAENQLLKNQLNTLK